MVVEDFVFCTALCADAVAMLAEQLFYLVVFRSHPLFEWQAGIL